MHRAALIDLLHRYTEANPGERELAERFLDFVRTHDDCLLRSCAPGHITASSWILSPDRARCLLTHHRKLGKWLQLGGHLDGEAHVERAALREAQEESGMDRFELVHPGGKSAGNGEGNGDPVLPLDLDVHPIPARGPEPGHLHWDVRFLLIAEPGQAPRVNDESHELRWFTPEELTLVTREESVLRLARKAGFS